MGTSLAEQLKKLRAPQTGLLLQDKRRPSLLFDPKEAANLDRETVLNIGQSGLKELIKLSDLFSEYESSLFAQGSLNFERSVQSSEVNRKLDASIEKFLIHLSPYFLLNTAHKALEWLICRYRIHQFNKDQFLLLILPYHETRIFVRALQLLDLSDPGDKWRWLKVLQKPGVPLASVTLINRVASDNALLKLLCSHVVLATKTYAERAASLSTLYAFYTAAVVGAIDRAPVLTEVQVNHVLPALIKGLGSNVPDFAASCYMIFAKLVTRAQLNAEIAERLLLKTFKHPQLHQEAVLLLILLYESPYHRLSAVSRDLAIRLSEHSWFVDVLVKIQSSSCRVSRFIVPFLQAACRTIWLEAGSEETTRLRDTIDGVISRVRLEDDDVDVILSTVVEEFLLKTDAGKGAEGFPIEFYRSLERGYPVRFDEFLKNLMRRSESDAAAKSVLQFVTSWHFGAKGTKESADILDGLLHVRPEQRILALDTLGKNDLDVPESFRETMTNALLARFSDSETRVVKSLLSIPVKRLTRLFPVDTLTDELTHLLTTCHTATRKALARPALKILLELCEDGDDTSVFIASLPYLFPVTDEDVAVATEVLRSNFAKGNRYMQQVRRDVGENPNAEAMTSAAFHNVLNWQLLPPTANILSAMKQQISHGDAASMFFNMILLGSVCRVHVGSLPPRIGREVIEMATEMIKKYPRIKLVKDCNNITGNNIQAALELTSRGILPLQVGTYVLEMVHRRLDLKAKPKFDFEDDADYSNLALRLLEMFFDGINNEFRSRHYRRCLQIFFQRHFATVKDLIRFLSQLFAKPVNVQTSFHCLRICSVLLNRCNSAQWAFTDKVFVSNLLLALARENNECRGVALEVAKRLAEEEAVESEAEPFAALLRELAGRSAEISIDPEQLALHLYTLLSPDPDVSSQLKSHLRGKLQRARGLLYDHILDPESPMHARSQLLDVLVHVNGPEILERLAPLGLRLLEDSAKERPKRFAGNALRNVLQRFNATSVRALRNSRVWTLFERSLLCRQEIRAETEAGPLSPSGLLLKQLDDAFFEAIGANSRETQEKIFGMLVDIASDSEISSVASRASKALRRIRVDARLVIGQLREMKSSSEGATGQETDKRRIRRRSLGREHANPRVINSREWKRGITLLEFVQRATNIENEELLYPTLFDLLKSCLSFEEQSPVEYANQLLLSTIHRLTGENFPIRDAHLHIDIITQCIRTSRNPQTHHHALLVLVELLKMVDVRCAMHTIMPIFTFMGSSVVRQDDAYSIQIISKTIDTVLPIVNAADNETHVCEILRTFIVSLPDIPEHRRVPLFVKLLQLLEDHLHLYYLLTFESHVLSGTMRVASQQSPQSQQSQQRLDFAFSVSREFSAERLLRSCSKVLGFMRELPIDIESESDRKTAAAFPHKHVYDVAGNTAKQLRHYKYILVQFVGRLLSAPDTINRLAELDSAQADALRTYYDRMIVELVLLLRSASKCADVHQGKPIGKYWKVLLHHLYDVLDLVNNLLPNGVFLGSIKNLIGHDSLVVKRKALELLNVRLQQRKFADEDRASLLELVGSLMEMMDGTREGRPEGPESEVLQQTVLIGVKLLGRLLAGEHPTIFKPVLEMATELLKTRDGPVLGSAALCVAELCASMRTYAIQSLNKFVPAILRLLETHCQQDSQSDVVVVVGIVSALQKIVESVGNFLSLYLDQLLLELARLNSLYTDANHPKIGIVVSRLRITAQKLSACVPLRVLLPAVSRTYDCLLARRRYECVAPLLRVLAESFNVAQPADLNAAITELTAFFLKVFQLREDVVDTTDEESNCPTLKDVVTVEGAANEAFVAFILKLSEATFRPVYYKLYDWAARNPRFKQRNITFFRLSANIADRLKSLFVLFAGHFLKHAATLLDNNNLAIQRESPSKEFCLAEEADRSELTEAILLTLLRVFTYDAHNFVDQERFETLAQPIVDQIENTQGGKEDYARRASELIVPCVGAFANAIPDDSLHKRLVYQTLLKTRHARPNVRTTALNALVEIARKLGEDFMPLLPETVPFLAELLEDEDESTEKSAQEAVRTLEEVLGEPLQKYF